MDKIVKFDRYVSQDKFVMEYRIDTQPQLAMLTEAIYAEIDVLTTQRKSLYKKNTPAAQN